MADAHLDARDLICPLPVLKARKALASLSPGDRLEVLTTDPAAPADVAAFCDAAGHTLVETHARADGSTLFRIEKGG